LVKAKRFKRTLYLALGEVVKKRHTSFFIFAVLGFELRAYTLSHSTSPCGGFFKIGSLKLSAQAVFIL
jgi:hypothetical protein